MSTLNVFGTLLGVGVTLAGALLANGLIGHPIDGQLPSLWGWSLMMMGAALVVGSMSDLIQSTWRHLRSRG